MNRSKGPWIADGNGFEKSYDVSNSERSICTVTTNRTDADLIAAAPEMLEAIQLASSRLATALKYGPDMASSRELCIRDAIDLLQTAITNTGVNK